MKEENNSRVEKHSNLLLATFTRIVAFLNRNIDTKNSAFQTDL